MCARHRILKRIFQNSAIAAASVCLCLAAAEGALWLLQAPRFYRAHSTPPQFSFRMTDRGEMYYVNLPSARIRFIYDGNPRKYFGSANELDHTTNSWGFRGGEFSSVKPPDTFRIAFLGDSFTFGEGVKDTDTYPERTSRLLGETAKTRGIHFESYNFGVGGYNVTQSLFLLEHLALGVRPDAVVLGLTLNDAEPELFYVDENSKTVLRRPRETSVSEGVSQALAPSGLLFRSRLAQLFWQALGQRRVSRSTENYYTALYRQDFPGWQAEQRSLRRFVALCRENRVPCYIVCFPVLYKPGGAYPFSRIHALLRDAVRPDASSNVYFIDLVTYLEGRRDAGFWVHPADQHPNELVHEIAAGALARALSKNILENKNE